MSAGNVDAWLAICTRLAHSRVPALERLESLKYVPAPALGSSRPRPIRCMKRWTPMVTVQEVRALAETLPRSYEVLVGGRVKFRVGRIVYLSFSRDQTIM